MAEEKLQFRNPDAPLSERVEDFISHLSLQEKIDQLLHESPAIERLGVPAYNWWNECLHGVGRAGIATVFPQAIAMAATFDEELMLRVATVISDEGRAKHHEALRRGDTDYYKGLTYWSPNINIFRDPRWGRGQETYGEDPHLTARLGVAFVRGLQGDDPKYIKLVATPKHFAVHSGPEARRHSFDARVSEKDLRETYLPHFKATVQEGRAESVMGAYNRTNGEPCCASPTLLQKILREEWGFEGYVVSDCGAIRDLHKNHKVTKSAAESAAQGLINGCDLNCGSSYARLRDAYEEGLVTDDDIDLALRRLVRARTRLGMFDPPERVPYAQIPFETVDCEEHRALSREVAAKSIVLLKNETNVLPLDPAKLKSVAVIGPNADAREVMFGNYAGTPSRSVTPLEGIRAALEPRGIKVWYNPGCDLVGINKPWLGNDQSRFAESLAMAERADAVIAVMGISPQLEGEQSDTFNNEAAGDRVHLGLPGEQENLLRELKKTGKPIILVLMNGGPVSVPWAQENLPAILELWYPGQEGGNALADVLFGEVSPAGRLPVTVVHDVKDLPPFEDYSMDGRTYRFIDKEPLYPFGFGLSYTTFNYEKIEPAKTRLKAGDLLTVQVELKNTGSRDSDEVVQVYLRDEEANTRVPHHKLVGMKRVHVKAGETQSVELKIAAEDFAVITDEGKEVYEPGRFTIFAGGSQPDARSRALGAVECVSCSVEVDS